MATTPNVAPLQTVKVIPVCLDGMTYHALVGMMIDCPLPACRHRYGTVDAWRKHVKRKHPTATFAVDVEQGDVRDVLAVEGPSGLEKEKASSAVVVPAFAGADSGDSNLAREVSPGGERIGLKAGVNYIQTTAVLDGANFVFHKALKVLICKVCAKCFVAAEAIAHPKSAHRSKLADETALELECETLEVATIHNSVLPEPLGPPVQILSVQTGYACSFGSGCFFVCVSRDVAQKHVQTLFSPLHRCFFEVNTALAYENDPSALLDVFLKEYGTDNVVRAARPANTVRERTPFLREMGWDVLLANIRGDKSKWAILQQELKIPCGDEDPLRGLFPAVEAYLIYVEKVLRSASNSMLVRKKLKHGRSVGQLPSNYAQHEKYWTPLDDRKTIHQYAQVVAKFVALLLRTLEQDALGFQIPLNKQQRARAAALKVALERDQNASAVLHGLFTALLNPSSRPDANTQGVTDPFSAFFALHALRADGLFDPPEVFTQVLAKFKYLTYACALLDAHALQNRAEGGLGTSVLDAHDKFLALEEDKPFNMFYEWMQFATSIVYNETKPPRVFWAKDMSSVSVDSATIDIDLLRAGLKKMMDSCRGLLAQLRGPVSLIAKKGPYVDELRNDTMDYSFLSHGPFTASARGNLQRMLNEEGQTLALLDDAGNISWNRAQMDGFLSKCAMLNRLLCVLCFVIPAISTRITQHIDHKIRNDLRPRNLHMINDEMILVSRYHKMTNAFGLDRYVPAFLPAELRDIMLDYLCSVRDTEEHFATICHGEDGRACYRTYLWVMNGARMTTEQFSDAFYLTMEQFCGVAVRPRSFRQAAISIAREHIPPRLLDTEGDNVADVSASHSTSVARSHYAVNGVDLSNLSVDAQFQFREISGAWHSVLGLGDSPPPRPIRMLQRAGFGSDFEQKTSESLGTLLKAMADEHPLRRPAGPNEDASVTNARLWEAVEEALDSDDLLMTSYGAPSFSDQVYVLNHFKKVVRAHLENSTILNPPLRVPTQPATSAAPADLPARIADIFGSDRARSRSHSLSVGRSSTIPPLSQNQASPPPPNDPADLVLRRSCPVEGPPGRSSKRSRSPPPPEVESVRKVRKFEVGNLTDDGAIVLAVESDEPASSEFTEGSPTPRKSTAQVLAGVVAEDPAIGESFSVWAAGLEPAAKRQALDAMRQVLGRPDAQPKSQKQLEAVCAVLDPVGYEVSIVLKTGGGKSLVWMAAVLAQPDVGCAVICPFKSLMQQHIATAEQANIPAVRWRKGVRPPSGTNLIFLQPESACCEDFRTYLNGPGRHIRRIFFDEAHELMNPHPERERIFERTSVALSKLQVQRVWLTATLPAQLIDAFYAAAEISGSHPLTVRDGTNRPELGYHVIPVVEEAKFGLWRALLSVVRTVDGLLGKHDRVLVFFPSVALADRFAREQKTAVFHAQLREEEAEANLNEWDGGASKIMAATTSMAQGIDRPNVKFVIVYDSTFGLLPLVQQAGRAGRSGDYSYCILLREAGTIRPRVTPAKPGTDTNMTSLFAHYADHLEDCRRFFITTIMDGPANAVRCDDACNPCDRCAQPLDETMSRIKIGLQNSRLLVHFRANVAVRTRGAKMFPSQTAKFFPMSTWAEALKPVDIDPKRDSLLPATGEGFASPPLAVTTHPTRPLPDRGVTTTGERTTLDFEPPSNRRLATEGDHDGWSLNNGDGSELEKGKEEGKERESAKTCRSLSPADDEYPIGSYTDEQLAAFDEMEKREREKSAQGGGGDRGRSTVLPYPIAPRRSSDSGSGGTSRSRTVSNRPTTPSTWGQSPDKKSDAPFGVQRTPRTYSTGTGVPRMPYGRSPAESALRTPLLSVQRANAAVDHSKSRRAKSVALDTILRGVKGCCPYHFVAGTSIVHASTAACPLYAVAPPQACQTVRARFVFRPYTYCYRCGVPQGRNHNLEGVICHEEIGYGSQCASCPWSGFIFAVVTILWHSTYRAEMLAAFELSGRLAHTEYVDWLAVEEPNAGKYHNALEVFLWFCQRRDQSSSSG